jgi:aminomethyltransferase
MKKTALYAVHQRLNARMVPFAGFEMPIQYRSIRDEHRRVRTSVGIFDISHMGEIEIRGKNALAMVQNVSINDASKLAVGQAHYTAMCYENGGIVDDLLVYRFPEYYLLVVNAANKDKDYQWLIRNRISGCEIIDISDRITQIAVQGKKAEELLQNLTTVDLSGIKYYWFVEGMLAEVPMVLSRTGYTGEPGFEFYLENRYAEKVWNTIITAGRVYDIEPIGLAARDSLRLEKRMCLYGNDIDETTNPLEAGLGWITKLDKGNFIGRDALLKVKSEGLRRKLIGFVLQEAAFPRKGYRIFAGDEEIGVVTSGTVSPMTDQGIGMGYVKIEFAVPGENISIHIRNKFYQAEIVKGPFV